MKRKNFKIILMIFLMGLARVSVKAQTYEIEQLVLDWQKLAALKGILQDLYKGYEILTTGYETIRSISEGNFNLHKIFLDGLLAVNPAVKNYRHVEDIIIFQGMIVSEYKAAFNRFKNDGHFTIEEIAYLGNVYNNLFNQSLNEITNLINVVTASKLRMSDSERLSAIDKIFESSKNQLIFLRSFNSSTTVLSFQRATDNKDLETTQRLYGLSPGR